MFFLLFFYFLILINVISTKKEIKIVLSILFRSILSWFISFIFYCPLLIKSPFVNSQTHSSIINCVKTVWFLLLKNIKTKNKNKNRNQTVFTQIMFRLFGSPLFCVWSKRGLWILYSLFHLNQKRGLPNCSVF